MPDIQPNPSSLVYALICCPGTGTKLKVGFQVGGVQLRIQRAMVCIHNAGGIGVIELRCRRVGESKGVKEDAEGEMNSHIGQIDTNTGLRIFHVSLLDAIRHPPLVLLQQPGL
jgi:hypothetical protein